MFLVLHCVACEAPRATPEEPAATAPAMPTSTLDAAPTPTEPALIHLTEYTHPGQPPVAVLVLLHGYGSNERDLVPIARQLGPSLLVFSVRAPRELRSDGFSWVDVDRSGGQFRYDDAEVFAVTDRLAVHLRETLELGELDLPVFALGFSQGGMMALELGTRHPTLLAGAISLSGAEPASMRKASAPPTMPVFLSHGDVDPVIAVDRARNVAQWLGPAATFREYAGLKHSTSPLVLTDLAAWLSERLAELDGSGR